MSATTTMRAPADAVSVPVTTDPTNLPNPYIEVARRAYELFEQRGCGAGGDRDDWLRAESELLRRVPTELVHSDAATTIRAHVLGFRADEISVCAERNRLIIYAKKGIDPQSGYKITYPHITPDTVYKTFFFNRPLDPRNATAVLAAGWLTVNLPIAHSREISDQKKRATET